MVLQVFRLFVDGLGGFELNFHLEDEERSGRQSTTDIELVKAKDAENQRYTVRE